MSEHVAFTWGLAAMSMLTLATVVGTKHITAPYGRYFRSGWGVSIPNRLGWVFMESPSALWFAWLFAHSAKARQLQPIPTLAAVLWETHYLYRAFVYPLLMRSPPSKQMPLFVALLAFGFNVLNSSLNATFLSEVGDYGDSLLNHQRDWLAACLQAHFVVGLMLFVSGFGINVHSDQLLRNLRKPQEGTTSEYKIPVGGLFEFVSCANYFGEIVEWFGFALLTLSPAALLFALYTCANLVPRALDTHQWYRTKFRDNYPSTRRAVVPGLL